VTARAANAGAQLGDMPADRRMATTDRAFVRAPLQTIFTLAADVERWPAHLRHYRYVRFRERSSTGGTVEMAANRPFGPLNWPTWWLSLMEVARERPSIRFRHIGGITTGMDVEWRFSPAGGGTNVEIVHVWDGPRWPVIGGIAATRVIGPVFIHGIASRTLAGLARAAESASAGLR